MEENFKDETVWLIYQQMAQLFGKARNTITGHINNIFKEEGVEIIIYEPTLKENSFNGCKVINDFEEFAKKSDTILVNRYESQLEEVKGKVYTRDLFYRD